ncbi:MAG: RibD family protein [Solirubrobacterales bacterium]
MSAPGDTHEVRRLLPDPATVELAEQLSDLRLVELAHGGRPYTVLNFASTVDGYAAIDGRSGPIGSAADTELLQRLRTQVDAVMIGAGTMRAERYGRMVADPQLRAWRERIGLPHDPLAVIVSGRFDLPWDAPLFTDGGGRVLVFTAEPDEEPPQTATPVRVVRHHEKVDLEAAMLHLRTERGIRALLCEGGPGLHAQLQREGLADELFLTIAPKLAGGPAPHALEGELPGQIEMQLAWLLEREGELFARYQRRWQ